MKMLRPYRRMVSEIALYTLLLMAATATYCALTGDLSTRRFATALFVAGLGVIVVAGLSYGGGQHSTRSFNYQFASTISRNQLENQAHVIDETEHAISFVFAAMLVAMLAMLIAAVFMFL